MNQEQLVYAAVKSKDQERLVHMAREKLYTALAHEGDYEVDEIEELIEEAIWDILAAAKV